LPRRVYNLVRYPDLSHYPLSTCDFQERRLRKMSNTSAGPSSDYENYEKTSPHVLLSPLALLPLKCGMM
jgi:hypothetical protein